MNATIEIIADQLHTPWSIQKVEMTLYSRKARKYCKIAEGAVTRQQITLKRSYHPRQKLVCWGLF